MTHLKISLLPEELQKHSSSVRRWGTVAFVLTIIALIFLAVNILLGIYVAVPANELKSLENENQILFENISKISHTQEMFEKVEVGNKIIESLRGPKINWVYSIDQALADITVYGINVDKLEIRKTGSTSGFKISANAPNIKSVNSWINHAKANENILYLNLRNVETESSSDNQFPVFFNAEIGIKNWVEEEGE